MINPKLDSEDGILIGWKAIAGYLGVCVDTAKVYAKKGMPISNKPIGRPFTTNRVIKEWIERYALSETTRTALADGHKDKQRLLKVRR